MCQSIPFHSSSRHSQHHRCFTSGAELFADTQQSSGQASALHEQSQLSGISPPPCSGSTSPSPSSIFVGSCSSGISRLNAPFPLSTFFLNLFSVLYLSDLSHSHYVCGPPRWGPAHHFPLKSADHVGHSLCGGWVLCSTCSPWLVLFPLFTSSINTSIYIKW